MYWPPTHIRDDLFPNLQRFLASSISSRVMVNATHVDDPDRWPSGFL